MSNLRITKHKDITVAYINRPKVLNALNKQTLEELLFFLQVTAKKENVKALIITGEGEKAFIAGADIKEMLPMNHLEMLEFCTLGQSVTDALSDAPYLTIAAINGYALGGGLEIALACDFIYASNRAKLGLPEVTLGIIPGFGGTQRLSRAVGMRLAKEMIMSGLVINAKRAQEIGIINHICEPENLLEDCFVTASKIISHSPIATIQAKLAINTGYHLALKEALELEKNMCAVCFATKERTEKMQQFLKKEV